MVLLLVFFLMDSNFISDVINYTDHVDSRDTISLSTTTCMHNPQLLRKQPYLPLLAFHLNPSQLKKWRSNDGGKQKDITDAIVSFVASDLQPLSVVESLAFRQILERAEPRYTVPSRKHLSSQLIPKRFTDLFTKVVTLMKCAPQVCLALDIWTNRRYCPLHHRILFNECHAGLSSFLRLSHQ